MTHVEWSELTKEIDDKPTWNRTLYKIEKVGKKFKRVQTVDIAKSLWRVVYNDGSHVDEIPNDKGYLTLKRKDVKSISVVLNGKVIHTVQVKDDWFAIRRKNLSHQIPELVGQADEFRVDNPKRAFVLATHDLIAYVWDDGDIDELDDFGDQAPYFPFEFIESEK